MLEITQKNAQFANPFIIDSLTKLHGVYVDVYDKRQMNEYDEGRDDYISNSSYYNQTPTYSKIKLLLNKPVQETYDSGEESFDSYMQDLYFITCDKSLVFDKKQKFEIFYNKTDETPQRVFQCFEVREFSNSFNLWSTRFIMLKPFN